jgi:hypothetical protein
MNYAFQHNFTNTPFPVPDGVVRSENFYRFVHRDIYKGSQLIANELMIYSAQWIGFQAGAKRKQCVWTYCDDEMAWESECEGMLQMEDSPKESDFKYCCYCGGELVEAGDA